MNLAEEAFRKATDSSFTHVKWRSTIMYPTIIPLHLSLKENVVSKSDKDLKPKSALPSHAEIAKKQQQKEEQKEVMGKHKNDGQKDHKGAR